MKCKNFVTYANKKQFITNNNDEKRFETSIES